MKSSFRYILIVFTLHACLPCRAAEELDKLAGKWSVVKTNAEGQSYTQTIEIAKDKLTFKIVGADNQIRIYAKADVKAEKAGPFSILKVVKILAGDSVDSLEPVDDDRTLIYQLDYDTWTIASNFDKPRDDKPVLDVY